MNRKNNIEWGIDGKDAVFSFVFFLKHTEGETSDFTIFLELTGNWFNKSVPQFILPFC